MESSAADSPGGSPRWLVVWGPAVLCMVAIFIASSIPGDRLPPTGISDKTEHFAAYGLLGMLAIRAFARARWTGVTQRAGASAWLLAAAYGVTDEVHQMFVINREPSGLDWIADALGAAAGVAAVLIATRFRPVRGREV